MSKIGYYVHHQGDGHRQRAISIAVNFPEIFTLIGTNLKGRTNGLSCIDLPDDNLINIKRMDHLSSTHYTPLGEPLITQRMKKVADWIADNNPCLMVVDVSVEIAMLARLFSIPTIYVRLAGNRFDSAHMDAFLAAEALLCPFSKQLELDKTPTWVKQKSYYFANLAPDIPKQARAQPDNLVVLLGAGGDEFTIEILISLARQLPNWSINVLGIIENNYNYNLPTNLHLKGWVESYINYIEQAAIVIGAAGDGVLANVLNFKKPYICVPQKRAFDEQIEKAKSLQKIGVEVIFDLNGANWHNLILTTLAKGPIITKIDDNSTAAQAAQMIMYIAQRKL